MPPDVRLLLKQIKKVPQNTPNCRIWVFSLLILICTFLVSTPAGSVENPLIITSSDTKVALGPYIEMLEDQSGNLKIDDVSSLPYASQFIRHHNTSINQGVTTSVFWFRFALMPDQAEEASSGGKPSAAGTSEWLLYLGKQLDYYDQIEIFTRETDLNTGEYGNWQYRDFGLFHAEQKGIRDPVYVGLHLPKIHGRSLNAYMRIEVESGFFLKPLLYSQQEFRTFSNNLSIFYGMYYGIVLSMIIYNLFHYFFLRDKVRLIFISYATILCIYFFVANELSQTIIPASCLLSTRKIGQFLSLITIIQIAWFSSAFLETKKRAPIIHLLLLAVMLISVSLIVALPFFPYFTIGKVILDFSTISVLIVMLTGVVSWYRGFHPARFFVFAWVFFLGGGLIYVSNFKGVFPYSFIGNNAFQAGSAVEMILLSLAIADRVKYLFDQLQSAQISRQEQLNALTQRLVQTEEKERRRIAGILHDSIGQTLFAIKWEIQRFFKTYKSDAETHRVVLSHLDTCIEETRSLNAELYPPELYDLGLKTAIDSLAEEISKKFDLSVNVSSKAEIELNSEEFKFILYRAVSELLNNVVKHAQAKYVDIEISKEDGNIQVSVCDDGLGFEYSSEFSSESSGFGLFSIQERLHSVGGFLRVEKPASGGAEVILVAPLNGSSQH